MTRTTATSRARRSRFHCGGRFFGTFDYTRSYLIDHPLDLASFDGHYNNDGTGRSAYDPALLLKIAQYVYAREAAF